MKFATAQSFVRTGIAATAGLVTAVLLTGCGGSAAYRKVDAGNHAFAHGQFANALAAYSAAKQLAPNDPVIQYDIGNTLHRLQRYDEAAASSQAAATTTKDGVVYARSTYAVGNDAFRRGLLTEARDAYIAVLQRDPTDHDARHNLEVVLKSLQTPPPGADQSPPQAANAPPSEGTATPDNGSAAETPPQSTTPGTNAGAPQNDQPVTPPGDQTDPQAAARARLQQALQGLTGTVTPEDALRILDAARQAAEQGALTSPSAPNPNDR